MKKSNFFTILAVINFYTAAICFLLAYHSFSRGFNFLGYFDAVTCAINLFLFGWNFRCSIKYQ